MIILHQEMRAKPEKCDEVVAALAAIIPACGPIRTTLNATQVPTDHKVSGL